MPLPDGNYVLCPYCLSDIAADTGLCPVCARDTTRDAKLELSPQEYRAAERRPCPVCASEMLKLALICPHCLDARPGL